MKEAWLRGTVGEVPANPGHYWIFIQQWLLREVYRDEQGVLRVKGLRDKRVEKVYPERWGKEF